MTNVDSRKLARLIRPEVVAFESYAAPDPVSAVAARRGIDPSEILKLDQNENPYGCSPRVREALRDFDEYHIYPDPLARETRAALAEYVGVEMDRIAFGNGSDELIELIVRIALGSGDCAIVCSPTFAYYATAIAAGGGEVCDVPRGEGYRVDSAAVLRSADPRTRLIFVATPNNPTGTLTPLWDIERLLEREALVVVDEAYYEFSRVTAVPLLEKYENLVVLRTFSKWAGLAGLRAGYAVAAPELITAIYKLKPPYSVNAAAEVAVRASLADRAYLEATVALIRSERDRLADALGQIPWLQPLPSAANFIMCELVRGDAAVLRDRLEERGILVRYYQTERLRNCIRFSVGRPEQNDRLLAAIDAIGTREEWA